MGRIETVGEPLELERGRGRVVAHTPALRCVVERGKDAASEGPLRDLHETATWDGTQKNGGRRE